MKKIFLLSSILAFFVTVSASAQQITKFAVVDTAKVYQAYFRDSTPVRNYENKKADFQKELDKLVAELQRLNDKSFSDRKICFFLFFLLCSSHFPVKSGFQDHINLRLPICDFTP